MKINPPIILGIDPGTHFLGYGVVSYQEKNFFIQKYGALSLSRYKTISEKFQYIYQKITLLLNDFSCTAIAMEDSFYGKNAQSMLKLGRIQGLMLGLAIKKNIPIIIYAPKKIKKAITGNGNASKIQVAHMVQKICQVQISFNHLDASDALATAICHAYQSLPNVQSLQKFSSWQAWAKAKGYDVV